MLFLFFFRSKLPKRAGPNLIWTGKQDPHNKLVHRFSVSNLRLRSSSAGREAGALLSAGALSAGEIRQRSDLVR